MVVALRMLLRKNEQMKANQTLAGIDSPQAGSRTDHVEV